MFSINRLVWQRLLCAVLIVALSVARVQPTYAQGKPTFAKITEQNVSQLKWQRSVSAGVMLNSAWSADAKSIFVTTRAGVYRYDNAALTTSSTLVSGDLIYTQNAFFSPDGRWLATIIGTGSRLRLINLATGEYWTALEDPRHSWKNLAFTGDLIVGTTDAHRLWVYSISRKRVLLTINDVNEFALHPDGNQVAVSDNRGIALWELSTLQQTGRFALRLPYAYGLRFNADGSALYTFDANDFIYALDTRTRKEKFRVSTTNLYAMEYADQGNAAILWYSDNSMPFMQIVDLQTGKRTFSLRVTESTRQYTSPTWLAAISADGKRVASLSWDNKLRVWDAVTGKQLREQRVSDASFLSFSPDGSQLLTSSISNVLRYDLESDQLTTLAGDYGRNIGDLAFSPDGKLLATAITDNVARLWRVDEWDHMHELRPAQSAASVYQAVFSPDSKTLLLGTNEAGWLYDLAQLGSADANKFTNLTKQACLVAAYSPDGKYIACNASSTVIVWDAAKRKVVWDYATLLDPNNPTYFNTLTFSADSRQLLIAPFITRLDVLDLRTLKLKTYDLSLSQPISAMNFSPDGKWLAVQDNVNTVHILDSKTFKARWSVRGLVRSFDGFRSFIAFSPDGSFFAAPDWGAYLRFFDTATGRIVAELKPDTSGEGTYNFTGITFSPDGTLLAGTTDLGIIMLWGIKN